jgi:PAS domain-containing protein
MEKTEGRYYVSYGEKTKKNPFLKEEAELLKSIRKRVCVSLEKRIENRRREHILNNAFDGFRINDIDGNIIEANELNIARCWGIPKRNYWE